MDYIFNTQIALRALDKFLEVNQVGKDEAYSEDVLIIDTALGYRESLLRLAVKPNFVVFDQWMVELLTEYLEEV